MRGWGHLSSVEVAITNGSADSSRHRVWTVVSSEDRWRRVACKGTRWLDVRLPARSDPLKNLTMPFLSERNSP